MGNTIFEHHRSQSTQPNYPNQMVHPVLRPHSVQRLDCRTLYSPRARMLASLSLWGKMHFQIGLAAWHRTARLQRPSLPTVSSIECLLLCYNILATAKALCPLTFTRSWKEGIAMNHAIAYLFRFS